MSNYIYNGKYGMFDVNEGFLEKTTYSKVVDSFPCVTEVVDIFDLGGNKIDCIVSFDILSSNGSEKKTKLRIQSLQKNCLFKDLGIIEPFLTKKKEMIVYAEVAYQYNNTEHKKVYQEKAGWYKMADNTHVLIIGKNCFFSNQERKITCESVSCYDVEKTKEVFHLKYNSDVHKIINYMPGLTEILFFSSILGAVKPILVSMGVVIDFMILINGRSGSLKTSFTRRIALWETDKENQEISFSTSLSTNEFEKRILEHAASNFLLDDLHPVPRDYTRKKFLDRLDFATRIITNNVNSAMVFVTAESSPKETIFSVLDRMLEVNVPILDSDELGQIKSKLKDFPEGKMPNIVLNFVKNIMLNFEEVREDIKEYRDKYVTPRWIDNRTRVGNIRFVMMLVSHLFDKWCCRLNSDDKVNFNTCLDMNLMRQTKCLQQKEYDERGYDVCKLLYELIKNEKECNLSFKLINSMEEEKYKPESPQNAYTDGVTIKITTLALEYFLTEKLGCSVAIKKVTETLHNAGVVEESADSRTKRFKGHRHLIINIVALKRHVKGSEIKKI